MSRTPEVAAQVIEMLAAIADVLVLKTTFNGPPEQRKKLIRQIASVAEMLEF